MTGNSSPFAAWSVISVTPPSFSSHRSTSETSAACSRNPCKAPSGSAWSYSAAALTSSRTFSMRSSALSPAEARYLLVARGGEQPLEDGGDGPARQGAELLDEPAELGDALERGAAHAGLGGLRQRIEERQPVRRAPFLEPLERRVADPPRGDVRHALHADVVGRVVHQPQVREQVLDLAPLVELGAGDDGVRDGLAAQRRFEDARLGVEPVEDGDVARDARPSRKSAARSAATASASSCSSPNRSSRTGSPSGFSVQSDFTFRWTLWEMTRSAARRIRWVLR